jgi:hypothetical protein
MSDEVPVVAEVAGVKTVVEAKPSTPVADPVESWIKALSSHERKVCIKACLDEYEACADQVRQRGRKMTPETLKICRSWGEHQKKLLRLLGHKHRMSIIGGARFDTADESIFSDDQKLPLDDKPPSVAQ